LDDPEKTVAVDAALVLDPVVMAHDRGHCRGVTGDKAPRPREQRRLDRAGHEVRTRGDVVEEGPHGVDLASPEDRVADEAVLALSSQQGLQLRSGSYTVESSPGDRREARVPVPLPRVAAGARSGVRKRPLRVGALAPVALQHRPAEAYHGVLSPRDTRR